VSALRHLVAASCASLALAGCASTPSDPVGDVAVPFESVQREQLAVAGSLSNAWADYDGDGDLDLAVSLTSGEVRLYRNDRGSLVDVGAEVGMPRAGGAELRGLSWGDYDGDGDVDLLGGPTRTERSTVVLRNGGGTFADVAAEIGLAMPGRSARQTNWVDYDGDGDLDVYATHRSGDNGLYRNDGGTYTRVHVGEGPSDPRPTVGACWFDMDQDGDLDLYLANQSGATDALWRNDRTAFVDVAPAAGMAGPVRTKDEGGVGCAIGDYDGDGDLDVFAPNYGRNLLYRNDGGGRFTEVGRSLGVGGANRAVGADWGDYDNDGDLDLAVAAYVGTAGAQVPATALYRNDGAEGFVNVLPAGGPLNVADHGVQFVDYDGDGGLDLSVTDAYGPDGGHFVFRNTLTRSARERSLSVRVLDAEGHETRFGAEVRLYDRRGRLLGTRQVVTGGGYNSQRAAPVHFGLAKLEPVRVEVTFLTRGVRQAQVYRGIDPRKYRGTSFEVRETRGPR
jgi:hypothetical protein